MVVFAVCVITAILIWQSGVWRAAFPREPGVLSADVAAKFYKGLAALDVEESELAAQIFSELVQEQTAEPALWANLAVAQLRLRNVDSARTALEHAIALADDSQQLMLLQAELLQQSGEIEEAIQQLRKLHELAPANLAATYSLATLLGQLRDPQAQAERLSLLTEILQRTPNNLRARCEHARLTATMGRGDELTRSLRFFAAQTSDWSDPVQQHFAQAKQSAAEGNFQQAALALTFMENLLKQHANYQDSLEQLGASSAAAIGTPLREPLRTVLPPVEAAPADMQLTFDLQAYANDRSPCDMVWAWPLSSSTAPALWTIADNTLRGEAAVSLPFPGDSQVGRSSLLAVDLNFDFRQDLVTVGEQGCMIYVNQGDGSFQSHDTGLTEFSAPWRSVWAWDLDADGDLDLLLSDHRDKIQAIQNNGDLTLTPLEQFVDAEAVRDMAAADLDGDGDLDLCTLSVRGEVFVWQNERGGQFVATATPPWEPAQMAIAVGDIDRDGTFEIITWSATGHLRSASLRHDGTWRISQIVTHRLLDEPARGTSLTTLAVADIDNNGAVDILASTRGNCWIWLNTGNAQWQRLPDTPLLQVVSVADMNGDGLLDLVGLAGNDVRVASGVGRRQYGWCDIHTTSNPDVGDKRINPFGIGGRIEVRAGTLAQAATISSPTTHFGLGHHERADVARIVWPNGTVQAEFDLASRATTAAKQRLKGSCPWVFTYDGTEFRFVKDFIWRSPLGLRINAQDTAGVLQTEDWIKLSGECLQSVDDQYHIRITAELWETHFFDHVSLLAVDHPGEVRLLVDERFVPTSPQSHELLSLTPPQPLLHVKNHRGVSLDRQVHSIDGVYADQFSLGEYQGVAEPHWVEFQVPEDVDQRNRVAIIGHGWVYPTDSSLNVALAQAGSIQPTGLVLEHRTPTGDWRLLQDNLGFPAGKNKELAIILPAGALAKSRDLRMRTNLEIYWDQLGWSYVREDVEPRATRLPLRSAQLQHRGFSRLLPLHRRRPDTPVYEVADTSQRWLDLEGYYTRFGDVSELLGSTDDRYVIMNAGDELALAFESIPLANEGWQRDFVLIGDGWVKDGDLNTAFSRWVRPLPDHQDHRYAGPLQPLERDPVFLRHPDDWANYHTRYVTPRHFQRGLWRANISLHP